MSGLLPPSDALDNDVVKTGSNNSVANRVEGFMFASQAAIIEDATENSQTSPQLAKARARR